MPLETQPEINLKHIVGCVSEMDLLGDWESFLHHRPLASARLEEQCVMPEPSPIYISTKTVIAFLDRAIDLQPLFWQIAIMPYATPSVGIIKKQMKFNSSSVSEVETIDALVAAYPYAYSTIMYHSDTTGKFKDVRKVTVGLSKKDLVTYRTKPKGSFYNCLVVYTRVLIDGVFKEFHVKVFNTGKIEIPGIQDDAHLPYVIDMLLAALNAIAPIKFVAGSEDIVLINSNFICNYFINREKLYAKLRSVHDIAAVYDPCSYPGIQCKLYYLPDNSIVKAPGNGACPISVMIFRTGSALIVGKATEASLRAAYAFLNDLLRAEYAEIVDSKCSRAVKREAKPKTFRKSILVK